MVVGLNSQGAWGRDAFDADYADCPAAVRWPAVADLTVTRQYDADNDDAGKIRIAWRALEPEQVAALGAALRYRSQITVIVEGRGHDPRTEAAPLGANELIVDNLPLATPLTVSAALTDGSYVMSHIATAEFGSSLPAPHFYAPFYTVRGQLTRTALLTDASIPQVTSVAHPTQGRFYYLGFGSAFRNYVRAGEKAFFRVGLAHGGAVDKDDLDAVDFAQYRLRVERAGADAAGFDAATVAATVYQTQVLHVHAVPGPQDLRDLRFASLRVTSRATESDAVPALSALQAIFPVDRHAAVTLLVDPALPVPINRYGAPYHHAVPPHHAAVTTDPRFAQWGLTEETGHVDNGLFAPGPHVYYDFPGSLFAEEGAYTLRAWAEDDDGARISPERAVTVHLSAAAPAVTGAEPFVTLDLWEGWTDDDDAYERQAQERVRTPCETGIALSEVQKRNAGLVRDCNTLLELRDTLDPTGGELDWSTELAIEDWTGISVCQVGGCRSGIPPRVISINKAHLTGTLPPG